MLLKILFNLRPPLLTGLLFFSCACFLFSPSLDFNNSRSVAKGNWFQRPRLWKRSFPVDRKNVAVDNSQKNSISTTNSDRGPEDRGEKKEKDSYQYSSKSVSFSLLNKVFGMCSPDEDLLAKMINKVGQVFGIGVKDVLFHLSCLDCIGGPVVLHASQYPFSNFTLCVDS